MMQTIRELLNEYWILKKKLSNKVSSHTIEEIYQEALISGAKGGICAFIDAEHALDPVYAKKLGVNTTELLISQPDTGEQALEIADTLVRSGSISVLVVDSVAALTPRAELEGEMGDHHMGLQARLMSQALRKLTGSVSKTNTMIIFINQIRMKIGVMFEISGVTEAVATEAMTRAMHKLPMKCRVVRREEF